VTFPPAVGATPAKVPHDQRIPNTLTGIAVAAVVAALHS